MNKVIPLLAFSALLLFPVGAQNAFAISVTWTGAGDGLNWEDANNWNPVGVPDQNDDVTLPDGVDVEINSDVVVGSSGSVTMNGAADITINPGWSMTNKGTVLISVGQNQGDILLSDSTFINDCTGLVDFDGDGMMWAPNPDVPATSGTVINHGTMVGILPGGSGVFNNHLIIQTGGLLQNSGTLPAGVLVQGGILQTIPSICNIIGGEFIPIDSTALLLAGAQTNAVWIMSALAVIGSVAFGALYITSKKN